MKSAIRSGRRFRLPHRAILWAAHGEEKLHRWFGSNMEVEVHAYLDRGKFCVVNNTDEPQTAAIWKGDGGEFEAERAAGEIRWYER